MKSIVTKGFMDNNACHKCNCKIAVKNVAKGTKYRTLSLFYLSLIHLWCKGYHVIASLEFWSWFELWVDQCYHLQYYSINTNIRIIWRLQCCLLLVDMLFSNIMICDIKYESSMASFKQKCITKIDGNTYMQ